MGAPPPGRHRAPSARRQRARKAGVPRELIWMGRLDGLAGGAVKLGPGLVIVALTAIAADLGASLPQVQLVSGATAAASALALVVAVAQLRKGSDRRPSPWAVLAGFGSMAAAMAGIAFAPNLWLLTAGLALLGASAGLNARYRYDAFARFASAPAAFQTVSRRWSQIGVTIGLSALGVVVAGAWSWRGAAAVLGAWFAVLGILALVVRLRLGSAPASVAGEQQPLGRQLKLHSVRVFLLLVVLAAAVTRAGQTHLEPVLADGLGRGSSLFASILLGFAQLAVLRPVARSNAAAELSPRREARRATAWMLAAAYAAAGAAASPLWFVTLAAAAAWMYLSELASGMFSQTTRLGLQRSGQVSSLLGVAAGNAGMLLGATAGSLPVMTDPLGLGGVLLAGGLACAAVAMWYRQRASRERITTEERRIVLHLRALDARRTEVILEEPDGQHTRHAKRGRRLVMFDGDALAADTTWDGRALSERLALLLIPVWNGPSWMPHRLAARHHERRSVLHGTWPRNFRGFVADDFSGTVRWYGAGRLACTIARTDAGIEIELVLPASEHFPVTFRVLRRRDLSELPRTAVPGPSASTEQARPRR